MIDYFVAKSNYFSGLRPTRIRRGLTLKNTNPILNLVLLSIANQEGEKS